MGRSQQQAAPTVTSLVARADDRQALADAIAKRDAARIERDAMRAAFLRADSAATDAFSAVDVAEAAVKDAQARHSAELTASVMRGDAEPGNRALAEAEPRADAARRKLASLHEARDAVRAALTPLEDRVKLYESNVEGAARAVLFAAAPDAIAAATEARRVLRRYMPMLEAIEAATPFGMSYDDPRRAWTNGIQDAMGPPRLLPLREGDSFAAEWRDILARLIDDADTPLPPVAPPTA